MLNKNDIKIIEELHKNGRATYSAIASVLGINSATVAKRIEGLMRSNVIDVRAMLNPYELGLRASALVAVKVARNHREAICNRLAGNYHISTILSILGNFDILCMAHYPSWEKLNTFITDDLGAMDGVDDFDCYYIEETIKRYHHLFGDGRPFKQNVQLKDLDWKLIELLSLDGRMSNSDLADKLGLHVSTISRRVSALLERDLIRIMCQPNPSKLGYDSSAIVTATVDQGLRDAIWKNIYPLDEVFLLLKIINRPCLVIGVHTNSNEMIIDLINQKVLNSPGIKKSETFVRSKVIKSSYSWYLNSSIIGNG
jgi:DNA-binding Lrp family transcriptional regulator